MVSSFDLSALTPPLQLHTAAVSLVRELRSSELALAEILGEMSASGGFRRFASSMADYAEMIGLGRGKGRQLTVIGRALPSLPRLHHVMRTGELAWTAAFEVARVATAETEMGWIQVARDWSVRELRLAVSDAVKGDPAPRPDDRPGLDTALLRFELSAEDFQVVSRAMTLVRSRTASSDHSSDWSPEEVLVEMARIVVDAEASEQGVSAERFTTVLRRCPSCETAELGGLPEGERAVVSASTVAMAACDSRVVSMEAGSFGLSHSTVTPRIRRLVLERDNYRCAAPGCSNRLHLDVHHVVHRAHGGTNQVSNLVMLCSGCHRRVHDGYLRVHSGTAGALRFERTPEGRWSGFATS